MPYVPQLLVRAVNKGVVVCNTLQYHASSVRSGDFKLYLPAEKPFEKKFKLGEVISLGPLVPRDQLDIGDIVVYQVTAAFRLPNGPSAPDIWKVEWGDSLSIITKLPNLIKERRAAHWDSETLDLDEIEKYFKLLLEETAALKPAEKASAP